MEKVDQNQKDFYNHHIGRERESGSVHSPRYTIALSSSLRLQRSSAKVRGRSNDNLRLQIRSTHLRLRALLPSTYSLLVRGGTCQVLVLVGRTCQGHRC